VLRINDRPGDRGHRVLLLEGKVCSQWLDELRLEIEKTKSDGKKLVLDFSQVTFIDEEGARLINQSLSDRVEGINCSLFIRTLLDMKQRGKK
jgi:anti-anti-sigma regulatory factor